MHEVKIGILLATFNGEKHLSEQLESIINQTYTNWELYIRDDNSSDNTVAIIKEYCNKDRRIHWIEDDLGNLKSVKNFSTLLEYIKRRDGYTMFSDQDDVWLPEKIESTLKEMFRLEKIYSDSTPLLVYTDFVYVDESLRRIESKRNFSATKIKNLKLSHLLTQNPAYGCTMMMNKKLVDIVGSIPDAAENHDHWIALVAAAFGKISYLPQQTVLYRQHGKNISTQHDYNTTRKRFKRIFAGKNFEDVCYKIKMAKQFRALYGDKLESEKLKLISAFIDLNSRKSVSLLIENIRNGVRRQTLPQTVLFYLTVMLNKKKESYN